MVPIASGNLLIPIFGKVQVSRCRIGVICCRCTWKENWVCTVLASLESL